MGAQPAPKKDKGADSPGEAQLLELAIREESQRVRCKLLYVPEPLPVGGLRLASVGVLRETSGGELFVTPNADADPCARAAISASPRQTEAIIGFYFFLYILGAQNQKKPPAAEILDCLASSNLGVPAHAVGLPCVKCCGHFVVNSHFLVPCSLAPISIS